MPALRVHSRDRKDEALTFEDRWNFSLSFSLAPGAIAENERLCDFIVDKARVKSRKLDEERERNMYTYIYTMYIKEIGRADDLTAEMRARGRVLFFIQAPTDTDRLIERLIGGVVTERSTAVERTIETDLTD